jgi:hypothetical protein
VQVTEQKLKDSSRTRVRPVFVSLLEKDSTGATWLPQLLQLAPRRDNLDRDVLRNPGQLLSGRPFEYRVAPPESLLRWLLKNPEALRHVLHRGKPGKAWDERRKLAGRRTRKAALRSALQALEVQGPADKSRPWWTLEGYTSVDCYFETDRLLLFIEGKRTDRLSDSTSWLKGRNQLVRNLEAAFQKAGKAGAVLLITEHEHVPFTLDDVAAGAPHLDTAAHRSLYDRYLGQITWPALCDSTGIEYAELPDTVDDLKLEPWNGYGLSQ